MYRFVRGPAKFKVWIGKPSVVRTRKGYPEIRSTYKKEWRKPFNTNTFFVPKLVRQSKDINWNEDGELHYQHTDTQHALFMMVCCCVPAGGCGHIYGQGGQCQCTGCHQASGWTAQQIQVYGSPPSGTKKKVSYFCGKAVTNIILFFYSRCF